MTAPNTSDQSSSSTPPGTPPPSALPGEYRYGADAPEPWMQGKTPVEIAALARQAMQTAQDLMVRQQQPAYQPPAQPQYQPDDYVTGAQVNAAGTQFLQQAQQFAMPAYEMVASTNLEMVKTKYAKDFARFGPEIIPLLSRIPKTDWSIDNISSVVDLVRGRHVDELANERAAQLTSSQDPALRSSGANGSTTPSLQAPDTGLTDDQREALRRRGITETVVNQFAAAKGISPREWYEKAGKYGIGDAQ